MDSEVEEPRGCLDQCIGPENDHSDTSWCNSETKISHAPSPGGATLLAEGTHNGRGRNTSRTSVEKEGERPSTPLARDEEARGEGYVATKISAGGEERVGCLRTGQMGGADRRRCGGGEGYLHPVESNMAKGKQRTTQDRSIFQKSESKEACREVTDSQPDNRQKGGRGNPATNLTAQRSAETWATKVRNGTSSLVGGGIIAEKSPGTKLRVGAGVNDKTLLKGRVVSSSAYGSVSSGGKTWGRMPNRCDKISDPNGLRTKTANYDKKLDGGQEATMRGQGAVSNEDSEGRGWMTAGKNKGTSPLLPQVPGIKEIYQAICQLDDESLLPALVKVIDSNSLDGGGIVRAVLEGAVGQQNGDAAEKVAGAYVLIREKGLQWSPQDAISALSVAGADEEMRSNLKKGPKEGTGWIAGPGPIGLYESPFGEARERFLSLQLHVTGICPTSAEARNSTWLMGRSQSTTGYNVNHVWHHEEAVRKSLEETIKRYLGTEGAKWSMTTKVWQASVNVTHNMDNLQLCGEACGRVLIEYSRGSVVEQRIRSLVSGAHVLVIQNRGPVLVEQWTGAYESKMYSRPVGENDESHISFATLDVRNEVGLSQAAHDKVAGAIKGLRLEEGSRSAPVAGALFVVMMADAAAQLQSCMKQAEIDPHGISFATWGSVSGGENDRQQNGTITATRARVSVRSGMPRMVTAKEIEMLSEQECGVPRFPLCRVQKGKATVLQKTYQTCAMVVDTARGTDRAMVPMVDIAARQKVKKREVEPRASSDNAIVGLKIKLRENSRMFEAVRKVAKEGQRYQSAKDRSKLIDELSTKLKNHICDEIEPIGKGVDEGDIVDVAVESISGVEVGQFDAKKVGEAEFRIMLHSADPVGKVFGELNQDGDGLQLAANSSIQMAELSWPAQAEDEEMRDGSTDDASPDHEMIEGGSSSYQQPPEGEEGTPSTGKEGATSEVAPSMGNQTSPGEHIVKDAVDKTPSEAASGKDCVGALLTDGDGEFMSPKKGQSQEEGFTSLSPGVGLTKGIGALSVRHDEVNGDEEEKTHDIEMIGLPGIEQRGEVVANKMAITETRDLDAGAAESTPKALAQAAIKSVWDSAYEEDATSADTGTIITGIVTALNIDGADESTFVKDSKSLVTTVDVEGAASEAVDRIQFLKNLPAIIANGKVQGDDMRFLREAARTQVMATTLKLKNSVVSSLQSSCSSTEDFVKWVEWVQASVAHPDIQDLIDAVNEGLNDGLWARFWMCYTTKVVSSSIMALPSSSGMMETISAKLEEFRCEVQNHPSENARMAAGSVVVTWVLDAGQRIGELKQKVEGEADRMAPILERALPRSLDMAIGTCRKSEAFKLSTGESVVGDEVEATPPSIVEQGSETDNGGVPSPSKKQKTEMEDSRTVVSTQNILPDGHRRRKGIASREEEKQATGNGGRSLSRGRGSA